MDVDIDVETIERTKDCEVCGKEFTTTIPAINLGGRLVPKGVPMWTRGCSEKCQAEVTRRWDEAEKEREKREEDAKLAAEESLRESVQRAVWPRYRHVTSDDLLPQLADLDPASSIILTGPTGTGKTHQAWAWWQRWALETQRYPLAEPRFYTAPDLLEALRRSYDGDKITLPTHLLLVIDDLGVERPTEWVMEQLYRLIDERYRQCAPLVVTSNLGGKEMRDRLGDRLVSRIVEMCTPVRIEGSDRRLGAA